MNLKKIALLAVFGLPMAILMKGASSQGSWKAPKLVVSNCSGCHGIDGNARLPYIPKLAGLQAGYAEKKLAAFREPVARSTDELLDWLVRPSSRRNENNATREARVNMLGISVSADEAELNSAAEWYSKQTPVPGHTRHGLLASEGREIFLDGIPNLHITACKTCHGDRAQGNAVAPRLAGQNEEYVVSQIEKFEKGDRKHAPEMTQIVRDLSDEQTRAVAAYLKSL